MASALESLTNGTLKLTITIPWADVSKTYDDIRKKTEEDIEVPGFRKGKAPKDIVDKHIDKTKIYEEVIKLLLPAKYAQAVKEHNLRPIIIPKVELQEATEGKDWIVIAYTCQKPSLTIGDYKKAVAESKATGQKRIWTPESGSKPEEKDEDKKVSIDTLLKVVYGVVTVSLPQLLIENEVNRLLSDLIDQTKKLGLTVEQYLSSTNRTSESIRGEYEQQAKRTLTLEFALEEIADKEGIFVSDDDIAAVIKTAKSDDERKALEKDRYYLASILRRQKTLDFLTSL